MSDSLHSTCLDFERQIFAYVGEGAPGTICPNANIGSEYTNALTGDFYKMKSTGWVLQAAGSTSFSSLTGVPTTVAGYGITDVYTKTAADARYLQLAGGTLTGTLNGTTAAFSTAVGAPLVNGIGSSATSVTHQSYVTGDSFARGYWRADGLLAWGSGAATADTNLYRQAASFLRSDGSLQALGALYAGAAATARTAGDINARRSSTQGAYFFGDSTTSYLFFDGSVYSFGPAASGVNTPGWIGLTVAGSALYGYVSAAQSANAMIVGSATGDVCIRSESQKILFSTDAGASALVAMSGTAATLRGKNIGTVASGTATPTGTPADGDLYFQHS